MHTLQFDQPLLSTALHPISTKDITSRLLLLHEELSNLEQDKLDLPSLTTTKSALVNKKLLKHPNNDIQILTACCLADVLRLYAPNAPYDGPTLIAIFKLFISQFNHLNDANSPNYTHLVYLLNLISEIKLVTLLTDLNDTDKLIVHIFESFYKLAEDKNFDLSLQDLFVNILGEIISEVNNLDIKILKLILNKFLANSKNLKHQSSITVSGFQLSLALCQLNHEKLSRFVTFFFSEMILDATKDIESDSESDSESDTDTDTTPIDLIQMNKIHTLAIELWRYVPEILTSVLGLLDNELEADNSAVRAIATNTINKILTIQPSNVNFPKSFVETYMNWLKKPLDVSIDIRIQWINGTYSILETRSDLDDDIINGLFKTLIDSNDKARLFTIIELSKLKPATFLSKFQSKHSFLEIILKLLRDRNSIIRNEVINFLSTLYDYALDSPHHLDSQFIAKIPNNILNLIYINDLLINSEIDYALFEKICPFNSNATARMHRLMHVLATLDDKAKSVFFAILKRQHQLAKVLYRLISTVEEQQCTADTTNPINWIVKSFPVSYDFKSCFTCFLRSNNQRLFRLLKLCVSESTDYDTIVSCMKEILSRVKDPKFLNSVPDTIATSLNSTVLYDSIKLLLLRSSNLFLNIDNVSELMDLNTTTATDQPSACSNLMLNTISETYPTLLHTNVLKLVDKVVHVSESTDFKMTRKSNDSWNDLKIIFNFIDNNNNNGDLLDSHYHFPPHFYPVLYKFAISGTVYEAKFAVKIINKAPDHSRNQFFTKIVDTIWPLDLTSTFFNTHLSTLATLFLCDLPRIEHIKDDLSKILANEILLKNYTNADTDDGEDTDTWIDDDELMYNPENANCLSKILTMKLLTNWLISIKDLSYDDIEPICKPTLSMLSSFINRGGEIVPLENTPKRFCSRLRLHAGIQMIKISQSKAYDRLIDQRRINRLILLIQDVEFNVRSKFLLKLKKRLSQNVISKRFLALMFFIAFEPDNKLKLDTSTWVKASYLGELANDNNNALIFEKSYIRLLVMIFNHPEFKELYNLYEKNDNDHHPQDSEKDKAFTDLASFTLTYMVYTLSLIITADNISLLYYLTSRIKQFKTISDEHNVDTDSCLYLISELSQSTIKCIGKLKNWNISIWPNKLNLPIDLLEKLDHETANRIIKTNYLPDVYNSTVDEIIRTRWRLENGLANANNNGGLKKNKRKIDAVILEEIVDKNDHVDDAEHQPTKPTKNAKKSRKLATPDGSEDDDSDFTIATHSKNKENFATTRRTRRSKRINYNED